MALPSPAYAVILPFLFVFTVPLAIFATLTTTFAFSILLFRVTLVYIELALAVIPHYLLGITSSSPAASLLASRKPSLNRTSPTASTRRRKRRASSSSTAGTITPTGSSGDAVLGLSHSIRPTRDFEGVGGWRLGGEDEDDDLWTNINSRLELPAHHERRHQRSLTGEGKNFGNRRESPEMMNTARARTPAETSVFVAASEGYFPQVPLSPKQLKRSASGITGASGSSGSSKSSSVLGMKQR